jgi:hypothetical protein
MSPGSSLGLRTALAYNSLKSILSIIKVQTSRLQGVPLQFDKKKMPSAYIQNTLDESLDRKMLDLRTRDTCLSTFGSRRNSWFSLVQSSFVVPSSKIQTHERAAY